MPAGDERLEVHSGQVRETTDVCRYLSIMSVPFFATDCVLRSVTSDRVFSLVFDSLFCVTPVSTNGELVALQSHGKTTDGQVSHAVPREQ